MATPTNQSSTEPRFPANQTIRQNSDSITTYDRAPNHDRVVLKLDSTRSEALQVISNLKSEFHTYHHREVVHISYERVGAGAWIPYKRGIDDVGRFICYRHS